METEGLNLHSSRPWQLAWIVCEGNKVIQKYDRYLDFPNLNIPDVVQKLTGFNWNHYNARKEDPKLVYNDFKKYLFNPEYKIVGQNLLGFDIYMVAVIQKFINEKIDYSYIDKIYDTRALGKAYREGLQKPKSNLLSWQYKIINDRSLKAKVSQNQLLKYFSIDFDERKLHEALYDVEMCFKVFTELKKNMEL